MKIVVLIPAYNESESIGRTIEAILKQDRQADEVVVIPNGCSDNTAEIARSYPVTVLELPRLEHRKSEALNRAWSEFGRDADLVISHDADTVLPLNALADWEREFVSVRKFGGSTGKFTVQQKGFFGRLQKSEYAAGIQTSLTRGWTNVLAGAGTAFSGEVLRNIADREDRVGPWSYESAVEDYELTYRIRELGFKTFVSPTVRAYTDGMSNLKSLWGQRMKWQAGTLEDLLSFGWTPLTRRDWLVQGLALLNPAIRLLWVTVFTTALLMGVLSFAWWGWFLPLLFIALNLKMSMRIPHRDWKDTLIACSVIPQEFLQILQGGWVIASWGEVIRKRVTKVDRDLWAAQYAAEGV